MISAVANNMNDTPEYAYHMLRGALEKFQKNVAELNSDQYQQAKVVADKTFSLESIVLSSPEARDIIIPESKVDGAISEVSGRYTDKHSFLQDLKNNGLDEEVLRRALYRELLFDAVMERVSAKSPIVSDIDVQIFYQLHKERFTKPEKRKVRHILITVNSAYAENDRQSSYMRINSIADKLQKNSSRFESLAKKYSECPTALEGGKLGEVVRGTLYPELDTELFSMNEGDISNVIETEMGFHVLFCEKVHKALTVPLSKVQDRIKETLRERQRKACQKAWLLKVQEQSND